jgi:Sulfite exporter TauE/SafE
MKGGLLRDVLALLLGFLTGVLSALFGIGGAILSNPGLRALGAAPLVAVGTTLPSILPGAISGTLRYRREGLIDWHLIAPAAAAGLLAVVGGSLLSHAVPGQGHLLLLLIAVLLALTAWRTAFTGPSTAREHDGPPTTRVGESGAGGRGAEGGGAEGSEGRDRRAGDGGAGDSREHPTSRSAEHGAQERPAREHRAPAPAPVPLPAPRVAWGHGSVGLRPGSAWWRGCCPGCWGSGAG